MPWNKNPSLQLQDMYDQVYSHLIGTSKHRDSLLQILGQVIIAQGTPDVDTFGSLPNTSSLEWIKAILGLEHDSVMQIVTELHLLLEVENEDQFIRIRHPPFLEFLLDRARSQDLFIDVDEARLMLQDAPAVIGWIFSTAGTWMCQFLFLESSRSLTILKVWQFHHSSYHSLPMLVKGALARCNAAGLTSSLPETLPDVIFGKYKSLIRSAPLDRQPYTMVLKQICAILRVRTFRSFLLPWTALTLIQESGFPGFGESDIDTKVRTFWDIFTWKTLDSRYSSPGSMVVEYVKLIQSFVFCSRPAAYMPTRPCSRR